MRFIFAILIFLYVPVLSFTASGSEAQNDPPPADEDESEYRDIMRMVEEGVSGPIADWHYYWKDGLRIDSPDKNFTMKINLSVFVDGGKISADDELDRAFPELDGSDLDLRRFRISGFGTIYDWAEFKLDMDFANIREIKDNYIRFIKFPYISLLTLGHMKEPFSLEQWASGKAITFMERALPVETFAPSRNIGIRHYRTALDERMTWGAGAFLNTGSFGDLGQTKDQISDANGWNITGRITYLPLYEKEGRRLLHLGLSYSHLFRNENDPDFREGTRTLPETRLTDDRLVNTDEFLTDSTDLINFEFATVKGPLSFQGEYFHAFENASALGDPDFWGFYLSGSYFITGEHRNYGRSSGTFYRLEPRQDFHFQQKGSGALELAARFSFVDLNDGAIRGGKEANFTAGLNWYLTRNTRFMFNYVLAYVKDRETLPGVDSGRAHIFQARFQTEF
ncbi:MAG: porin [Desulfobacteraceae bacterium]|jgi:phosphate-selective porin OprO/OprP